MRIRVKKKVESGVVRLDAVSNIEDVKIEDEGLLDDEQGGVFLYFKGKNSSGILDFNLDEAKAIINTLNNRLSLGVVKAAKKKKKKAKKKSKKRS
tara:strand:+ start:3266 stop:3550 length:285 start_codon:yes stop_codon:yes gene_type:complete